MGYACMVRSLWAPFAWSGVYRLKEDFIWQINRCRVVLSNYIVCLSTLCCIIVTRHHNSGYLFYEVTLELDQVCGFNEFVLLIIAMN